MLFTAAIMFSFSKKGSSTIFHVIYVYLLLIDEKELSNLFLFGRLLITKTKIQSIYLKCSFLFSPRNS